MKPRSYLLVLMALSLAYFWLVTTTPIVAADSITVAVDKDVHALGEAFGITVSYMGDVHGDMKLSLEDASGIVINEWTWDHASSDPFQQSVSYAPTNAGAYTIKALHQPHHMEPPITASVQVAVWSAKILGLEYANAVDAGKPVDVKASISYYFTQPTPVKLELWSSSESKSLATLTQTMIGQGTTTLTFTNVVFSTVQSQDVTAQISYQSPSGNWIGDASGGTYAAKVTVVPEFAVTPALILLLTLLSTGLLLKRVARKHTT